MLRSATVFFKLGAALLALLALDFGMRFIPCLRLTSSSLRPVPLHIQRPNTSMPALPASSSTTVMLPLSIVELLTLDASSLATLLNEGRLTSVSLIEQVLAQISREDQAGAGLRAILSVAPRDLLLKNAALLDDERKNGKLRSPLHGLPILIKDAIMTHPDLGMPTTVGSFALLSSKPAENAGVVERLIKNGLIILGKTNLNEFCNWKGFNSINGFSALGGQTNSAYVIGGLREGETAMGHSSPCGSSTGSAVGVSAGFSPLALGTETDGSLVQPAGRAALFALKPTVGSVEMDGTWLLSSRFDSIGAITKSVYDLAIMTEMLHTDEARSKLPEDGYSSFLNKSFKGLKVGFLDAAQWHLPAQLCPQIDSVVKQLDTAYENAITRITSAGADVHYPVTLPGVDNLVMGNITAGSVILLREYKGNINSYLGALEYSDIRSLGQLIDWNKKHAEIELPFEHSNQGRLIKANTDNPDEKKYQEAIRHLHKVAITEGFDPLFRGTKLDILAVPMDSRIPSMATASGYPIATMPLGVLEHYGRPFGLAIMAKAGREDLIFQFMSAFEEEFPKRVIPPQLVRFDEDTENSAPHKM